MFLKLRRLRNNPIYLREADLGWYKRRPAVEVMTYWAAPIYIIFTVIGLWLAGMHNSYVLLSGKLFEGLQGANLTLLAVMLLIAHTIVDTLVWLLMFISLYLAPPTLAPLIKSEVARGTWDILRVLPYSPDELLLAKILGGSNRYSLLRNLVLLTFLSLLITLGASTFLRPLLGQLHYFLLLPLISLSVLKPVFDVAFVIGMTLIISIYCRSSLIGIIYAYGLVIGSRVFTNPWLGMTAAVWMTETLFGFGVGNDAAAWIYQLVPAIFLLIGLIVVGIIFRRAIPHLMEG